MGFLSAYSKTTRVPIGDPERGYWVELREVVSQGAREKAEQELTAAHTRGNGDDVHLKMNVVGFRQAMLLASIANWNLDDDNGHIWPVNMTSIHRLPAPVFDQLWVMVDESNAARTPVEQRSFRDEGDDGGEVGTRGPAESEPLLAPAAGVEAPWVDPGAVR